MQSSQPTQELSGSGNFLAAPKVLRMSSSWLAVYSRPNCEKSVAERLLRLGAVLYLYVEEKCRIKRGNKYQIETVERPFFSRYLFSQAGPFQSSAIKRVEGVCAVVSRLGEPLLVPDRVIGALRTIANEGGCIGWTDFTKASSSFKGKVGSKVQISWPDHILDGFITRLTSVANLDTRGEVSMFLRFLGSEREVSVPVSAVRLLSEAAVG